MILYIAGPCTGYPNDNYEAFEEAERRLTEVGYVCINPTRYGVHKPDGMPDAEWLEHSKYVAVIERCILDVERAQGMVLLPGWRHSNGATKEHFRATCRGLRTGSVENWLDWDVARCIKWVGDPECVPTQSYPGDAGFDLVVSEQSVIHVGCDVDVPLGVSIELPEGVWALLTGRSSTLRRRGILVAQGIIDNGYRGPLFAACRNMSDRVVVLARGERVAQLIPMSLQSANIGVRQVGALSASERGDAAFGSSGGFAVGAAHSSQS